MACDADHSRLPPAGAKVVSHWADGAGQWARRASGVLHESADRISPGGPGRNALTEEALNGQQCRTDRRGQFLTLPPSLSAAFELSSAPADDPAPPPKFAGCIKAIIGAARTGPARDRVPAC